MRQFLTQQSVSFDSILNLSISQYVWDCRLRVQKIHSQVGLQIMLQSFLVLSSMNLPVLCFGTASADSNIEGLVITNYRQHEVNANWIALGDLN